MAITVLQAPDSITPAYNDINFLVTSTNKAQANFKYIADINIGSRVERIKLSPHPTYGNALFDFGRIVETFVNSDISKSTYSFQQNTNSYVAYTVRLGEEFGLSSSGTTIYPNLTTYTNTYAFNAEFSFLDFQNYASSPYYLGVFTKRLLTNSPSPKIIRDDEDEWLHMISNSSGTIYYGVITRYDSNGDTIGSPVKVLNDFQNINLSTNSRFLRFSAGTRNLNLIPSSGIASGAQPIITAATASYDIYFSQFDNTVTSETREFTIDNACTKNDTYRFHFLNKLGGFDSFTFIRASTKKVEITRSKYKKAYGTQTATTYGYNKYDRGEVQFNTSLKDNIKVKSDWIDEETSDWLEELITSPEVYLDDPTHGLVAVLIQNSNYDIKQTAQDKLFNLEIEFEYSFNRYRQRS